MASEYSRINRHIRKVLRVKHGDSLPYTGWHRATRRDLAQIFADLEYKCGAEIGVAQGTYSGLLLNTMPELHLYCVDPYEPYERITQRICDERRERAHRALHERNTTFIELPSLEAINFIEPESLDFVYIDGNHDFDHAMMDLILWAPKVRSGGMVTGHDYYNFYKSGVCRAVDAYTLAHNIGAWYLTKEKEASFLWVKK